VVLEEGEEIDNRHWRTKRKFSSRYRGYFSIENLGKRLILNFCFSPSDSIRGSRTLFVAMMVMEGVFFLVDERCGPIC